MRRVYVSVLAEHGVDGSITPRRVTWEDGAHYDIDRVLDVRMAASAKAGGFGTRYVCRICGKQTALYYDQGEYRWFMEGK